jgi:glycosyltransferase involved in cell wall biosynthesis
MKNKNIKFSVVIPAYNASEFIKDTLDSIKNQTYKNYEVLVTIDGSIDNTENVLKEYKKINPGFPLDYTKQKNSGVSIARNNAISRATGDYIAFLDQDDLWLPHKLEKTVKLLNSNIEIDVLYHKAAEIGWGGVNVFLGTRALKEPVYLDLLFNGGKIGISTAVVKRDKLLAVKGFSPNFFYSEDYDLWLRLARQGANFYFLPDLLSKYIWQENSGSNKVKNMIQEKLEIFEYNFRLIGEGEKYDRRYLIKKYRRAKSAMLFGASRRFYFLNNYKEALDYIILAIKADHKFWKPYIGLSLSYLKSKFSKSH